MRLCDECASVTTGLSRCPCCGAPTSEEPFSTKGIGRAAPNLDYRPGQDPIANDAHGRPVLLKS